MDMIWQASSGRWAATSMTAYDGKSAGDIYETGFRLYPSHFWRQGDHHSQS